MMDWNNVIGTNMHTCALLGCCLGYRVSSGSPVEDGPLDKAGVCRQRSQNKETNWGEARALHDELDLQSG